MKILLGMSGGVDSTYAALKLKRAGHTVEGACLLMHEYTDTEAARLAASEVGIPFHIIDAREPFKNIVCENFVSEYNLGRTPNPCVVCNSEVKFKYLWKYAGENGFDAIATGHYARVNSIETPEGVRYFISRATDLKKDQSYMLWRLSQSILSHLILPLSDEVKRDIVEVGRAEGISAADKKESQEICFIPDGDYASYVEEQTYPSPRGSFIDAEGKVLGEHRGIIRYTVGQRKGLDIALGKRIFVTKIDPQSNTITLEDAPRESNIVNISNAVFSKIVPPTSEISMKLGVKLRYLAPIAAATVVIRADGSITAYLEEGQKSVTPGQSAVFYDGDDCVFGGFINSSL